MNDGSYLIPANSKRGQLIFNIFKPIDLWIAGVGASITTILFVIFQPGELWSGILVLLPFLICAFLVVPVPNYHNIRCVLTNIYKFYFVERQQFTWKGWCVKDEYKD